MDFIRILLEFTPIFLAFIAISAIVGARERGVKYPVIFLASVACILSIVAQTGWIQAVLTDNTLADTVFNNIWTIFNSIVMLTFIVLFKR